MANEGNFNDEARKFFARAQSATGALAAVEDMFTRKTPSSATVAMAAANTEYNFAIPAGSSEVLLRLRDTAVAWRFSFTTGQVAGGAGTQMKAGDAVSFDGPFAAATIYFASGSASQTLDVVRLAPS